MVMVSLTVSMLTVSMLTVSCSAATLPMATLPALPPGVAAGLASRGIVETTPIQTAAYERALGGESLVLHAETGSGKSLAFMLPALCRTSEHDDAKLLVLSPTKELSSQLAGELSTLIGDGALPDGAEVALLTPGHPATHDTLQRSRVIVATPTELCQKLAPKEGGPASEEEDAAMQLAACLARDVACVVLDEVDALVPGRKEFRGKRHWKWLDRGMHPTEGVVKFFARRSERSDLQLLAASATLDRATRAKLDRQLRPAGGAKLALCSAAAPRGGGSRNDGDDGGGGPSPERLTAVPSCIRHRTLRLSEQGAPAAAAALRALHGGAGRGGLVFVSSRSAHLGGANAVARELSRLGVEATALSDALWPASTRAIKRLPKAQQRAAAKAAAGGGAREAEAARRAALNAELRGGAPRLVVADAAATRGLHLDGVARVYVLGLPANADTYLHLAGRTGRWPRPAAAEGGGGEAGEEDEATVVTIASEAELRTLHGWSNGLGGVEFTPIAKGEAAC